jgi:hypothetical protein
VGELERALHAAGAAAGTDLDVDPTEAPARVRELLAGH